MQITEHMDVEILPQGDIIHLNLKAQGKLTHQDYQVFIPMVENAIKMAPNAKFNVLLNALDFEGWELEAAWDDFKFGMEFKDSFQKIAIVGTKKWQEYVSKMGDWFMDGEVLFFYDLEEAKAWVK